MPEACMIPGGVVRGRKNPLHFGLSQRLKRMRQVAKLSRRRLAEVAGVTEGVVRYIEGGSMGERTPGVDTVEKLALALGVSPCWLGYSDEGVQPFRQKTPGGATPGEPAIRESGQISPVLACASLPARLLQVRQQRGLSRRAMGQAAGISGTAVLQIEDRRIVPTVATVESLARALDVSPCWLAYGVGLGL